MTPDKFQRLMELFQQALELGEADRLAFVESACVDERGEVDVELRDELRALLAPGRQAGTSSVRGVVVTGAGLAAFAAGSDPAPPQSAGSDRAPALSGNYRLMRVIGEGGMGIVYEAEQAFPRRTVAIKALKPGVGGASILRRFQNEAQVLARMQHPGIAQVYEAGLSDDSGTPGSSDEAFFVMEYVQGPPLNVYCDSHKLSTRRRLELMLKVCDAVQHAHQRGVIHRDLKPANILVAESEGGPQPKVLDFGVARVEDVRHQFTTVHTHAGQIIGTLAYMSPEQLIGGTTPSDRPERAEADIDVRADVYALGVIAYQLLTGRLPLELTNRPLPEIARIVRDESPPRLGAIDRSMRGDLETIVAKALEKDRERRYSSAAAFAEDIRRFLAGEPILARRDSTAYVVSKLVRRHKAPVAAAAVALAGIVAFAVIAAVQARANRVLANSLADELHHSRIERGRLVAAAGNVTLSEDMLWQQWVRRPGDLATHWALREFYARLPILASGPMVDGVPSRLSYSSALNGVAVMTLQGQVTVLSPTLDRVACTASTGGTSQSGVAAISPDGRFALVGAGPTQAAMIDLSSGQERFRIELPPRVFNIVAYAPDGASIALGGTSGDIEVFDASTGTSQGIVHSTRYPTALQFMDDRLLLVGHRSGIIHVVDVRSRTVEHVVRGVSPHIHQLTLSADGGTLLALADGGTLDVIDVRTWTPTRRVDLGAAYSRMALFDGDARIMLMGKGGIRLLSTHDMSLAGTVLEHDAGTAVLGPDARFIYTIGFGPAVRMLRAEPSPFIREWPVSRRPEVDWVFAAALSPDQRLYATGTSRGFLRIWDVPSRALLKETRVGHAVRAVAFDHSGTRVAFGGEGGVVQVCGATDLVPRVSIQAHPQFVYDVAFLPDGDILTIGSDRTLRRFGPGGELVRERIVQDSPPTSPLRFALSPDASRIALTGSAPALWVGSTADFSQVFEFQAPFSFMRARFSPDGSLLAVSGNYHSIDIRDGRTFQLLHTMRGHEGPVVEVAFDESSAILFSGSIDSTLRAWDARSGDNLATLASPIREQSTIRPLAGGRNVLVAGSDGIVREWDLAVLDAAIARNTSYLLERIPRRNPVPDADLPGVRAWAERALRDAPPLVEGPDNGQLHPDSP